MYLDKLISAISNRTGTGEGDRSKEFKKTFGFLN